MVRTQMRRMVIFLLALILATFATPFNVVKLAGAEQQMVRTMPYVAG